MRYLTVALFGLALAGASVVGLGCAAPRERLVVTHRDAAVKIPAMKKAVREQDQSAIAQLVCDLDSDDPAVRLYAIKALEKLTGQRLGYQYYYDEEQRKPSLTRWQEWLAAQQKKEASASRPAVEASRDSSGRTGG
jgi:hypothetical protein